LNDYCYDFIGAAFLGSSYSKCHSW